MKKVFDLRNNEVLYWDDSIDARWAVAFPYCEEQRRMSALLGALQDDNLDDFYATLPFTTGKQSIACGDFACYLGE